MAGGPPGPLGPGLTSDVARSVVLGERVRIHDLPEWAFGGAAPGDVPVDDILGQLAIARLDDDEVREPGRAD